MVFVVLLGFLTTWVLLNRLIPWLRSRMLDNPNSRSSHELPTPRGGGVVFVLVSTLASVFLLITSKAEPVIYLSLIATPLAIVGFFDDRFNLPVS